MKRSIFLFLVISVFILQSCGSTLNVFKQIIGQDPEPPEGYKPVFIKDIKQINNKNLEESQLIISRTDPYKENKVKIFLHLVEGDSVFLSGASDSKWKKIWCKVIDSSNGEINEIKNFTIKEATIAGRKPQAIAMIMDHSGSMGNNRAIEVQKAVDNFLNNAKKKDDWIALIKYDDSIGVECPLTKDIKVIRSKFKMDSLGKFGRSTATIDAISKGIDEVSKASPDLERVIMVFTDGQDNKSKFTKDNIIAQARKNNTIICAIDYGVAIQEGFLDSIAAATNGTYHHIYAAKEFNLVYQDIYTRLEHYYELEYEPQDFGHHHVTVKLCNSTGKQITADGTYDNVPYQGLTTLLNVYFDTNKDVLKSESDKAIKNVANMMKKNPGMTIEVRGHTDSKGSKDKNLKLSQDRANSVRDALIAKSISGDRIKAVGYGDSMPVADNQSENGRSKNRRTEFVVLNK
jgi:outer membrane protein OmpA-like peptidoglycan-associated protein/uncharacterized protein YegL